MFQRLAPQFGQKLPHQHRRFQFIAAIAAAARQRALMLLAQVAPRKRDTLRARDSLHEIFHTRDASQSQAGLSAPRTPQVSDDLIKVDAIARREFPCASEVRTMQSRESTSTRTRPARRARTSTLGHCSAALLSLSSHDFLH
jgi:hypothetical protein